MLVNFQVQNPLAKLKGFVMLVLSLAQLCFFLITAKTDEALKAKESMKEDKTKEKGEPNFKCLISH